MSTLNHLFSLPEQICYVQCGFCATILMVSVPCSSLSMVVTVRCGHCTSLLSVNMMKASFVPLHVLASFTHLQPKEVNSEEANKSLDHNGGSMMTFSDCEDEDAIPMSIVTHKPPEKRQRTPSAYNRFIKEEIRRLKTENPGMAHKKAFSTAAKNWACKGDEESYSQSEQIVDIDSHLDPHEESEAKEEEEEEEEEEEGEGQGFRERKVPRNSIWERTSFE